MGEIIFLIVLAFIWILFATINDLRKSEIPDWLNFSLIIFALGFRFFYSLFSLDHFNFFYQGLIGFGIFFLIGNLFYYGKMFAGGDAKLMISLGSVLPFSKNLMTNFQFFGIFIFTFLLIGALYGIIISFYFAIKNFSSFKKEFKKKYLKFRSKSVITMFLGIILMIFGVFIEIVLFYTGILIFITPLIYIYSKAIDESCMVQKIKTENLREGDWLHNNLKIGKRTIKADWEGLNKEEIRYIRNKKRFVVIRNGIAFAPVFLISFSISVFLYFSGFLGNSFG